MTQESRFPAGFLWGAATSAYQIEGSPLADGAGVGGARCREKADLFLDRQSALSQLQMENLHEERGLTLSHLRWRRVNDWFRAAWQLFAALGVTVLLVALAADVIGATRARGLVIDGFSVPPDLEARGLSREATASEVLVRLNRMSGAYLSYEQGGGVYRRAAGEPAGKWTPSAPAASATSTLEFTNIFERCGFGSPSASAVKSNNSQAERSFSRI